MYEEMREDELEADMLGAGVFDLRSCPCSENFVGFGLEFGKMVS